MELGLNLQDFRVFVVRPALYRISKHSQAAENLVLGTAIHESHLKWLDQMTPGPGPAYGLFQMEKATHDDIWQNYLAYNDQLRQDVLRLASNTGGLPNVDELHGNLIYAAAMCRVHYARVPAPLPGGTDIEGLARYWKQYYNTPLGKGTVEQATEAFRMVL
jgi:hypothetical protein